MTGDGDATTELAELEAAVTRLRAKLVEAPQVSLAIDNDAPSYASYAKALIDGRARLPRYVPCTYLGDPAFDMLLDLFVADEQREARSFKCCALAARVPPATASRYVDMMERDGFVTRETDQRDRRRTLVSLTPFARDALREWLASISSIPLRREWPR